MQPDPATDPSGPLAGFLAGAFGPSTVAVIHYGSHAQGRRPSEDSAFDFFVIVDDYRAAYTSLKQQVGTGYSPGLATRLANRLPPNVISVTQPAAGGVPGEDEEADRARRASRSYRAKCCVMSLAHLERACSPKAPDHFCQGRLMQFVVVSWVRDERAAAAVSAVLASVRERTLAWVAPSLPERFSIEDYLTTALRRSLAGEIRPESADHARTLMAAQRDLVEPLYRPVFERFVAGGALVEEGSGMWRLAAPATRGDRRRVDWYFRRSKARATLRLFKHVVLYEGWLDYVVRKVERSGAGTVALTERERRWPLIFLWPRFIRFVWTRPQRRQSGDNTKP